MTEKQRVRQEKKRCRDALTKQERAEKSARICAALRAHPLCLAARYVYCYAPLGSEADIRALVDWLLEAGKKVAFPRVISDGEMEFFAVRGREDLREGAFHVMEPADDGSAPVDWEGALVLTPLVSFSADGMRCGYGGGYYDRYFSGHPNLVRMGVGFSCQRSEKLRAVCADTDVRLDYVQTEDVCYEAAASFSYEEMVGTICGSRRFGRAPGVVCSAAMMELLGHPERALSFVHIAGTNGKGSVAAFLREICVQEGICTGLFTSPHLQSFTERIQVGHTAISQADVVRLGRRVLSQSRMLAVSKGISCTMFDLCFAMALLYYVEQGVELVILETGMGGRLDSTNCIPAPLMTIITAIGLEHTEYLGDTPEKIAAEKAGILKSGTRAVLMEQQDAGAQAVLTNRCAALGIPYRVSTSLDAQGMYELPLHGARHYETGMRGAYQRKNAAAALEAAELLVRRGAQMDGEETPGAVPGAKNGGGESVPGFPYLPDMLQKKLAGITPEGMMAGIAEARWPGRMELVRTNPWVLLDGAHNAHGVLALAESLRELDAGARYVFFLGVMAEKDYMEMAELIFPLAKHIYTLAPESARALPAEALCERLRAAGMPADVCGSASAAAALIEAFSPEEKCVVCGSLYLIGEVRERLSHRNIQEENRL